MSPKTAARQLARARRALKLAQEAVAHELGCTVRWLALVERGDYRPNLELAVAIERKFGIPVEAWLEQKGAA